MLIEPATVDHGDAVESCYASLSENSGEEVANDASNSMTGEDLKIDDQLSNSKSRGKPLSHIESVVVVEL